LDLAAYQSQLIVTLGVAHSLAEKHGRQLIPFFLSLASDEAKPPLPRYKLTMWLELFAKFTNPKALYATDRMLALHTSLLAHPDKGLQSAALSCLMTYKPPHVHPHEATLRLLLDETRWRDALAQLDFAELPAQDRVEMVDVIIRLLYGVMLERRGRGRGADRRTAILSLFAACTSTELRLLVDLMLQSFSDHPEGIPWAPSPIPSTVSHKQQNGFLHLLADVIRNLGPHVVEEWHRLLSVTLDICANAQSLLTQAAPSDDDNHDEEQEDQEQGEVSNKGIRTARQLSLKRVTEFFGNRASFDFSPYLHGLFEHIISPRLAVFDRENTQAPSALMELFRVWATKHEFVLYLQKYDTTVLSRIFDCVNATNVKPTVVARIFDIVEMILGHAERDEKVAEALLLPNVEHLLSNLVRMVERSKGTDFANTQLGQRQLGILSRVAKHVQDEAQAATLLGLLLPMLLKTHKVVNDRVKADVLLVVRELLPLVTSIRDTSSPVYGQTYRTFSQLFQTIRARQGRLALVAAFVQLAELNPSIVTITTLLADLNAYSIKRMDEPDFDRRLQAFATLNRQVHSSLSADGWLPFLFNMLYFIQDANELAVRSSASLVLRQFIDRVGMEGEPFEHVFLRILYPALRNGLRTKNEMVRGEVLGVIAYSIQQCSNIAPLQEMRGLLADGDEEANFFNNVLHVQIHRRTRALRRLAEYADQDRLRNATITDIFVPLVENFVASTNEVDHHLVNEAILTLGRLARHLTWGSYYALVQSYLRVSKEKKEKDGSERVYVRTLVAILDSFHFPMGKLVEADAPESTEKTTTPTANTQKISDAVKGRLLPALLQHLENREGAEENIRLPIAIGIIQIALHLPEPARHAQISRLLTAVSQILRSKSQDTRDLVRETFRRVAVLLGSSYLPMILKELRAALTRGPQLHVLAFAVHNILAFVTAPEHIALFDNLNACVTDAVHVSAEVVFGESGKDVQSEDFKTNMKEVRSASSKGLDTFALLAQHIHPAHISGLLQPLRAILQETSSQKALNTVDDVLRRIASGLNANEFLQPVDLLPLCHTLISQNARFLQEASVQKANGKSSKVHNVTVQLKRKVHDEGNYYAANAFR
jgi:U3 small nucleolar RNA-associated protein 20